MRSRLPPTEIPFAPLSWLFRAGVVARNVMYDREVVRIHRLPVPVLSVGNLTVGGTGKTPVVARLGRRLAAAGRRPVILSRGYAGRNERRRGRPPLVVSDGRSGTPLASCDEAGDEALLLAALLPDVPVVVCADRHAGGRLAVAQLGAGLILLDDGFQHRRLHRDADLLTVDAEDPLGGGRLLPAGRLREPISALRRAHAAVITRADGNDPFATTSRLLRDAAPHLLLFRERHRPAALRSLRDGRVLPPCAVRGRRVGVFAGLANPGSLVQALEALGAHLAWFQPLPDHHPFGRGEVMSLLEEARRAGAEWVVTSAKDAVRLGPADPSAELMVLDIEAAIDDEDRLVDRLLALCLPPERPGVVEAKENLILSPPGQENR